jgi:uncharacterized membrane protein (DUF4010 family)
MSLFTGKYQIAIQAISSATLIAISSNNLMKLGYAIALGNKAIRKPLIAGFFAIIAATVVVIVLL